MPLIVSMSSGKQYLIEGESVPHKAWKPGKVVTTKNLTTGREIKIFTDQVATVDLWPQAAWEAEQQAKAAAEKEEAENAILRQMANKGRNRMRIPGRRRR